MRGHQTFVDRNNRNSRYIFTSDEPHFPKRESLGREMIRNFVCCIAFTVAVFFTLANAAKGQSGNPVPPPNGYVQTAGFEICSCGLGASCDCDFAPGCGLEPTCECYEAPACGCDLVEPGCAVISDGGCLCGEPSCGLSLRCIC